MKDRRVRLRPRDGARWMYYSGGGFNTDRVVPWVDPDKPWNSTQSFSNLSPTIPNLVNGIGSQGNGSGRTTVSTGSILEPLSMTDGLVFPYTPTISTNYSTDYSAYDPTHSNQEILAYSKTKAPTIGVSGDFTAQNATEAAYALACIHFLRSVVKMSFGQSRNPGVPPPILNFSAYGEYMFNDVPVILTSFDLVLGNDVDYVTVPNTYTSIPSKFTINCSMTVQNSPTTLREFSIEDFRSGRSVKNKGWI